VLLNDAALFQNTPNPFGRQYHHPIFPAGKFTKAHIVFHDKSGKLLKQISVSGVGNGTVKMDAGALSSGSYSYSLVVDGETVSTRQLVIAK